VGLLTGKMNKMQLKKHRKRMARKTSFPFMIVLLACLIAMPMVTYADIYGLDQSSISANNGYCISDITETCGQTFIPQANNISQVQLGIGGLTGHITKLNLSIGTTYYGGELLNASKIINITTIYNYDLFYVNISFPIKSINSGTTYYMVLYANDSIHLFLDTNNPYPDGMEFYNNNSDSGYDIGFMTYYNITCPLSCGSWASCLNYTKARNCSDGCGLDYIDNVTCYSGNTSYDYCFDNDTLITGDVYLYNGAEYDMMQPTLCPNGCDNTTNSCTPTPAEQSLWIFVIIVFLIIGGIVLIKFARSRR
jgi:hypothetical protein